MKKVSFVISGKGGIGKSTFQFMCAEKYPQASLWDMDDDNRTTLSRTAFRNPQKGVLRNEKNKLDEVSITEFFEGVADGDLTEFICDLGSPISNEFINYFMVMKAETLNFFLTGMKIDFQLLCVIGGADMFQDTMHFAQRLADVIEEKIKMKICVNTYFKLSELQESQLSEFLNDYHLPRINFTLTDNDSDKTVKLITDMFNSGQGFSSLSFLKRLHFIDNLNKFNIYG